MLSPQEVAEKFDGIGLGKANLCVSKAILLGILAGMYIALAAVGANTGGSMMENPGVAKIISSLIFPAGLAMVVLAGSELFTGDCLMLISNLDRKITVGKMLRCWILVYVGNLIGSLVVAFFSLRQRCCHGYHEDGYSKSVLISYQRRHSGYILQLPRLCCRLDRYCGNDNNGKIGRCIFADIPFRSLRI